jgi:hypothetical protein
MPVLPKLLVQQRQAPHSARLRRVRLQRAAGQQGVVTPQ